MKQHLKKSWIFAPLAALLFMVTPAFAQCEDPNASNAAISGMVAPDITTVNNFITAQQTYTSSGFFSTAFVKITDRLYQFTKNFSDWVDKWWENDFSPDLKDMTKELHVAVVDQTHALGNFTNAQVMLEEQDRKAHALISSLHRYSPAGLSCDIDETGPGLARSFQISRAVNRGLGMDDVPRHANDKNSLSASGKAEETKALWTEYVQKFCDNTMGDLGCTQPGTIAGRHKDIPALLWGTKQTIDPANPDNLLTLQASLRYLINPLSPEPIQKDVAEKSVTGHFALLSRRAELAYANTIYNVMGQMLSERIGGSNVDAQTLRAAAGVTPADASTNASYRELEETMTHDRYNNPQSLVRLMENPVQMAREQDTLNALRLQTMNDIYRRSEEMLFMEAAEYSRDLYKQVPHAALSSAPIK